MANYLDGKVAIVTGAGRGIGAGVAKQLAAEGAKVIVNDIGAALDGEGTSSTPAEQVVEEIKAAGGDATPNYTDISTMEGGESIVKSALDNYDKLDIVVTVAGILRDRMIFNMTEEEWDDVIRVHLKGTFTVCKYASILYRQQRSGRIITFASDNPDNYLRVYGGSISDLGVISNWFNERNIKTPRGSEFNGNYVFSILKKGRIREERLNKESKWKIESVDIILNY